MSDERVQRTLAELQQHPLQPLLLADVPADQFDGVERDLRANGLATPVEILPDNTVVAGWHNVLAAQRAGWKEIDVKVQHDLAEQGEAAVQCYLVRAHLRWRQPDPLDLARLYQRLVDYALGLPRNRQGIFGRHGPKAVMAEWLGRSRRNFGRYSRVLRSPNEVQSAFLSGALSLGLTDQVAGMSRETQEGIAQRIQNGEEPTEVVRACLPQKDGRHKKLRHALNAFVRNLRRGVADLQGRADQDGQLCASYIAVLEQAEALIGQLLRQAMAANNLGADRDHDTANDVAPDSNG